MRIGKKEVDAFESSATVFGRRGEFQHRIEIDERFCAGSFTHQAGPHRVMQSWEFVHDMKILDPNSGNLKFSLQNNTIGQEHVGDPAFKPHSKYCGRIDIPPLRLLPVFQKNRATLESVRPTPEALFRRLRWSTSHYIRSI